MMDFPKPPSSRPSGNDGPENPADKGIGEGARNSLSWKFLGGNNKHRIGMNSGLCSYTETDSLGQSRTWNVLFDAGMLNGDPRFPEDPALSESDTIIPDLSRFLRKRGDPAHKPEQPLDAIFLTHSHSDHLGALPFMLLLGYELPKIYATPYTARRLEQELANAGLDPQEWPQIITTAPGQPVQEGPLRISSFWVSHSTPQSVGFFVETSEGNILHPGDFKLDQTVLWGPAFNEDQFRRIVSKPVDLLLLDSTGADHDITPTSEEDVRETLRDLMEQNPGKRFVIAVMSGFEEGLASVARVAGEYDRTLWVAGWSHEQSLAALQGTGLSLSDCVGVDIDVRVLQPGKAARDLAESKPGNSVVVVTGAVGSPNAVLPRAADGHHNALTLDKKNDIIVFCAPSIPGQEGTRERLLAILRSKGFKVLTRQDATLYSQAHARLPELLDMARLANAKTVVPIHGDRHLRNNCTEAIEKLGQKVQNAENGDTLHVSRDGIRREEPADTNGPRLLGFKTLQGQVWTDRHYMMTEAPQPPKELPPAEPANGNQKKRPKIFNITPK